MDAEKLIEEADRLAHELSASKFGDRRYYGTQFAALAAALRETVEKLEDSKAELAPRIACIGRMEVERKALCQRAETAEKQRDDLAAANVAANKRIVELEHERDAARAELARLTTPRPIAEAPKDGAWIGAIWEDMDAEDCQRYEPIAVVKWRGTGWEDSDGDGYEPPSHFLPLPVLP